VSGVKSYQFDVDVAVKYGVSGAIILRHLQFWIFTNRANGKHFHDNRTWTYGSVRAFVEIWPFWSIDHISRTLNRLVSIGVLVKGNYNFTGYDRTSWYAFVNEKTWFKSREAILQKRKMDSAKTQNGFCKSAEPIPNQRTDKRTDKSQTKGIGESLSEKKSVGLVLAEDKAIAEAKKHLAENIARLLRPRQRGITTARRWLAHLVRIVETGKFGIEIFQKMEDKVKEAKTDGRPPMKLFNFFMKRDTGFAAGKSKK